MEHKYYNINEETAKRAKEMISFSDYKMNSLTETYKKWWMKYLSLQIR